MIFTNTASDKEEPPPPGWVRCFSKSAKRPYYLHVATKHSQWEYPSQTEVKNPTLAKKRRDNAEAEKQRAEALRQEEAQKKVLMEDEKERQLQLQYQIAIQKRNEEAILSAIPASTNQNVNGKRSRSNDAKRFNQVRARSEHRFENHSRVNWSRWEPPSSSRQQHSPALEDGELIRWEPPSSSRQQHSPALEDGELEERETTMEQHQEHRMTNISNMQLHSNEMQLSSQKDLPRYDHRMLQEPSWNDRPQQKQHPHNRPRYDHHRHNRVTQQRPYARPQYDQVQSSLREVRFENSFSAYELVQTAIWNSPLLDSNLLSVLWNKLSKKIGSFQPRHLSLTIHGIAKILSVVKEGGSIRDGNCVEAAFHSLLLDNTVHHGLFDTVANHIVALENLTGFSSQSLANIVWAFAKVELPHCQLFSKIAEHIASLQRLDGFNSQDLSNIVWAFAKVELPQPELFSKIAEHITELHSLEEFMPQHLSNTLWAFAEVDTFHQELFHKVNDHFMRVYLV
ncbi:hypothetical protein QTG54_006554 [Skeletonema marinoi]|uniref:WW domain-containing protein n=1 Tax=Skeletonema marinoi TaxID=267567 RepID=A0AAD8YCJ1_9STRA|nr:hypothetical protein QTG54_006554 [Skeletonema marinoi]